MISTSGYLFDEQVIIPLEELAERMGIYMSKKNKRIAPPLELVYSELVNTSASVGGGYILGAVKVNGHKNRCLALNNEWNKRFEIDNNLEPILVVDIAPKTEDGSIVEKHKRDKTRLFCVELTDVSVSGVRSPDVVINYQIGVDGDLSIYKDRFGKQASVLLGKDYFFFDEDGMFHFDGFVESDKPNVIVIPNGNKKRFFDRFDFLSAYEIMKRSGGGSLNVINDVDRETLANFLDLSSVVVTTPSITAMECLSLGFPVLLIQTSNDQTGSFIEHGLANWYNEEVLAMLIDNVNVRKAMGEAGKKAIKNNSEKVVDIIYQEWLKKGNKNG